MDMLYRNRKLKGPTYYMKKSYTMAKTSSGDGLMNSEILKKAR